MRLAKIFGFVSLAAMLALMPACSSGGGGSTVKSDGTGSVGGTGFSNLAAFANGKTFKDGDGNQNVTVDFATDLGDNAMVITRGTAPGINIDSKTSTDPRLTAAGKSFGYTVPGVVKAATGTMSMKEDGSGQVATSFADIDTGLAFLDEAGVVANTFASVTQNALNTAVIKANATVGIVSAKLTAGKDEAVEILNVEIRAVNKQLEALEALVKSGANTAYDQIFVVSSNSSDQIFITAGNAEFKYCDSTNCTTGPEDGIIWHKGTTVDKGDIITAAVLKAMGFDYDTANSEWVGNAGIQKLNAGIMYSETEAALGGDILTQGPLPTITPSMLFDGKAPLELTIAQVQTQPVFGDNNLRYVKFGYLAEGDATTSTKSANNNSTFSTVDRLVIWEKTADEDKASGAELRDMLDGEKLQMNATFTGNTVAALTVNGATGHLRGTAELNFVHGGDLTTKENLNLRFDNWYNVYYSDANTATATISYKNDAAFGDLKLTPNTNAAFNVNRSIDVTGSFTADYYAAEEDPLKVKYAEAAGKYTIDQADAATKFREIINLKGAFGVSTDKPGITLAPEK